jgi:hypothetical protein
MDPLSYSGDDIDNALTKAHNLARSKKETVEFTFNSVKIRVSVDSRLPLLRRDYSTAILLDWPTVGPDSQEQYPEDLEQQIQDALSELEKEEY